jgi:hypothetical protein
MDQTYRSVVTGLRCRHEKIVMFSPAGLIGLRSSLGEGLAEFNPTGQI